MKLVNYLDLSNNRLSERFIVLVVEHLEVIYIENNEDLVICIHANAGLFIKSRESNSLESICPVLIPQSRRVS
jgi:hypothetical protein